MLSTVDHRRSHEADVIAGTTTATVFHQLPVEVSALAVVAGEVKGLASRTREATNGTAEMISAIQEASESTAGAVSAQAVALDSIVAR